VLSQVYAVVTLNGPQVITDDYVGDVVVDGSLTVGTGHTTITGDVVVFGEPGTLDMGQGSAIVGDVYAEGDVTMGQSSNIHCDVLCTEGNISMGQSTLIDPPAAELTTEIHFLGPGSGSVDYGTDVGHYLVFENTATLWGNIFSEGDLTIEINKKHTDVYGKVIVDGDLTIIMDGSEAQGSVNDDLYATGDVTIQLDPKKAAAGIFGTLYYDDESTYTSGPFNGATYPDEEVCTDFESDCTLPEPLQTCPGVPDPNARVISWEIS